MTISMVAGHDTLAGGFGKDTFVVHNNYFFFAPGGNTVIQDFVSGIDRLELEHPPISWNPF